ncbi:MAG: hypothetical protein ACRYG2_30045 [Janthinobacterium lividum]
MVVSTEASGAGTYEETGADDPDAVSVLVTRARDPRWVDAGPFRAHLVHLMSVGPLSVPEVAVVLGLSTRAVRHLVEGRSGRLPRRISPQTARRLLLVRADDVRGLRWCLSPAASACTSLRRLRAGGWSTAEVAAAVGFGLDELASLGHHPHCNRLLAVRLVGLARLLPGTRDDQDLVEAASAA